MPISRSECGKCLLSDYTDQNPPASLANDATDWVEFWALYFKDITCANYGGEPTLILLVPRA